LPKKKKIPNIVKFIRNNPPPPIDFTYQKVISISQINMFQNCNKQWALRYKDRNKPFISNIHSIFGTAIHKTVQHYLNTMYETTGVEADKIELDYYFKEILLREYQTGYKKNKGHFSTPEELREAYDDGVEILKYFKKKKGVYFNKKGWYLIGCEMPIQITPIKTYSNVVFVGYLDIVMYHEPTNTIKIIDIKTSKTTWNKKKKNDKGVRSQLILYKYFFSKLYDFPIENIEIEFFIVKRKLYENCDFVQKRIQIFVPPSGKTSINFSLKIVNDFIKRCFEPNGKIIEQHYKKNISEWSCRFCPWKFDEVNCPKNPKLLKLLKIA